MVAEWWLAVGFFIFALVAVNLVYFTRGLPLKYLLPGLLFLLVFQVFTIALHRLLQLHELRHRPPRRPRPRPSPPWSARATPVGDSADYPVVPVEKDGTVSMLVTFPRARPAPVESFIGTNESLTPCPRPTCRMTGDKVTGVTGYTPSTSAP